MADTSIAWTDKVWNPVTGCSKGCEYCYARRIANRHLPQGGFVDRDFSEVRCHPERLEQPLHWRKPCRIFVDSMGDLFDPQVPDEFISRVVLTIATANQHTFIVLTKQAPRMLSWSKKKWTISGPAFPLQNLILGVSVTNQADADERIPILLQTPAAVRAVSIEPMRGPVDLGKAKALPVFREAERVREYSMPSGTVTRERAGRGWVKHDGNMQPWLDWVICGGQTGPKAIPLNPVWARSLRDQCQAAATPFFFKSWGDEQGVREWGNNSRLAGCVLDGREWREHPDHRHFEGGSVAQAGKLNRGKQKRRVKGTQGCRPGSPEV